MLRLLWILFNNLFKWSAFLSHGLLVLPQQLEWLINLLITSHLISLALWMMEICLGFVWQALCVCSLVLLIALTKSFKPRYNFVITTTQLTSGMEAGSDDYQGMQGVPSMIDGSGILSASIVNEAQNNDCSLQAEEDEQRQELIRERSPHSFSLRSYLKHYLDFIYWASRKRIEGALNQYHRLRTLHLIGETSLSNEEMHSVINRLPWRYTQPNIESAEWINDAMLKIWPALKAKIDKTMAPLLADARAQALKEAANNGQHLSLFDRLGHFLVAHLTSSASTANSNSNSSISTGPPPQLKRRRSTYPIVKPLSHPSAAATTTTTTSATFGANSTSHRNNRLPHHSRRQSYTNVWHSNLMGQKSIRGSHRRRRKLSRLLFFSQQLERIGRKNQHRNSLHQLPFGSRLVRFELGNSLPRVTGIKYVEGDKISGYQGRDINLRFHCELEYKSDSSFALQVHGPVKFALTKLELMLRLRITVNQRLLQRHIKSDFIHPDSFLSGMNCEGPRAGELSPESKSPPIERLDSAMMVANKRKFVQHRRNRHRKNPNRRLANKMKQDDHVCPLEIHEEESDLDWEDNELPEIAKSESEKLHLNYIRVTVLEMPQMNWHSKGALAPLNNLYVKFIVKELAERLAKLVVPYDVRVGNKLLLSTWY